MRNTLIAMILVSGAMTGTVLTGCTRLEALTSRPAAPASPTSNAPPSRTSTPSPTYPMETGVGKPVLKLGVSVPPEGFIGRPFDVALSVVNKGRTNTADTVLEMPVPPGLVFKSATGRGSLLGNTVVWIISSLPVESPREVSCTLVSTLAGRFEFTGTARGEGALPASAACHTRVTGMAALLLEKVDDPDPVPIGETTTYTVKVTNQGTAEQPNLQVVVTLPEELTPVSGTGECTIAQQTVSFPVLPKLAPKETVTYSIKAKGAKAGDARTRVTLTADGLTAPVVAEESTTVY